MWGRKSVYGKHVHEEKQIVKKPELKKQKSTTVVKKSVQKKPVQKKSGISDFEREYQEFIAKLRKQQEEKDKLEKEINNTKDIDEV